MEFNDVINARYSVRSFDSRSVEQSKVERILETAKTAPTAKNMQPVFTLCIQSESALEKLNGISPCIYGAPLVFAVCSDENRCWVSPTGKSRGEMDASIAATHIMLSAVNEGLGTCWVCMFDADRLSEEFDIPENIKPQCLIAVGYPSSSASPSERHTERRPLSESVRHI